MKINIKQLEKLIKEVLLEVYQPSLGQRSRGPTPRQGTWPDEPKETTGVDEAVSDQPYNFPAGYEDAEAVTRPAGKAGHETRAAKQLATLQKLKSKFEAQIAPLLKQLEPLKQLQQQIAPLQQKLDRINQGITKITPRRPAKPAAPAQRPTAFPLPKKGAEKDPHAAYKQAKKAQAERDVEAAREPDPEWEKIWRKS